MAHSQVRNQEQLHHSMVTSIVKAQSLWSKAFDSNELHEELEILKGIGF
jgi:hypothetical protein